MRKHGVLRRMIGRKIGVMFRILSYPMATQQRQHGLISDEYGFLVGSRRLEQGIESVDDKVQRIVDLLENKTKPTKIFNSRTVAQNHVAKSVDKLVALTEKTAKESQRIKAVNSQTLRNNGENRIATCPTKVVNSQTGATNSSESVGSLAAELSTDQPTRTVNSQTSQQAQDRQRDANGRFIGGEGEQSKSSGGLFKGMTQAVRNGFLQANSDGQNLDPSIDALYEVKNILSPVGRVAALTLRPLGALFKSKKRNEPLSREEEKHNKKEIKLLERIARMGGGGGGGGLLGGLGGLFKKGGKGLGGLLKFGKGLPIVGALLTAMSFSDWGSQSTKEKGSTVGAGVGGIAGGAIGSLLGPVGTIVGASVGAWVGDKLGGVVAPYFKVWTDSLVKADIPAMLSKAWDGFIDLVSKAFNVSPVGAAIEAGKSAVDWIKEKVSGGKFNPSDLLRKQHGGYGVDAAPANDSPQSAGGSQPKSLDGKPLNVAVYDAYKKQGLSHNQALAITAEVGRENDFNSKVIFGKHTDPAKDGKGQNITNMGMLSWNRKRAEALQAHLKKRGVLDEKGNMIKSQAALDAQAEYSVMEMKGDYAGKMQHFLNNPNASPESFAKEVGKNYVGWAYGQSTIKGSNGGRVPFDWKAHDSKRKGYLQNTDKTVQKFNNQAVTATAQKTGTPKSTALPPTISKPPVVPSLSMKPTINMKAQPIQFRSAAKVEAIPKIETVPEMHTSPKPMLVQSVNSGDNISQNLSDRGLAHLVTGGLGENRYGA